MSDDGGHQREQPLRCQGIRIIRRPPAGRTDGFDVRSGIVLGRGSPSRNELREGPITVIGLVSDELLGESADTVLGSVEATRTANKKSRAVRRGPNRTANA
jgi:hypothetical protein